MSTVQRIAGMPVLVLESGARVVLEAINPTTGAQVSGVDIRNVAITYEPAGAVESVPLPPALLAYHPGPN